jgi:hypothetical protein
LFVCLSRVDVVVDRDLSLDCFLLVALVKLAAAVVHPGSFGFRAFFAVIVGV